MTIIREGDFGLRYRVAELLWHVPAEESMIDREHATTSTPVEYKTLSGAEAARDRIVRETGRPALLQVGVVQWLSDEAASELIMRLQAEGGVPS